jgi:hypothetical protein
MADVTHGVEGDGLVLHGQREHATQDGSGRLHGVRAARLADALQPPLDANHLDLADRQVRQRGWVVLGADHAPVQ